LIALIIILSERKRIGDPVRRPPRQLITVMMLSHVVVML
jgi:hypothetical protein